MSSFFGFCSIDEAGRVFDEGRAPISNPEVLEDFFEHLHIDANFGIKSELHGTPVIVEAFDEPLVASSIHLTNEVCNLRNFYGREWSFPIDQLSTDEWDRFHGVTQTGLPFVMSATAQDQFFTQLDEFSDNSITWAGKTYPTTTYWNDDIEVETEAYWSDKYRTHQDGWDIAGAAAGLISLVPKLKLPASRIVVLGGGGGHDAALFAQQGHHVTLVDISPEAINKAKQAYGHLGQITFIESDLFDLPKEMYGEFDIAVEHTCYCAINPSLRQVLVSQWKRLLSDNGFLLGVFFAMPKRTGPPFGGSEWELQHRLKKDFQTIIWQRFRNSIKPRLGRELLVYAQKKPHQ